MFSVKLSEFKRYLANTTQNRSFSCQVPTTNEENGAQKASPGQWPSQRHSQPGRSPRTDRLCPFHPSALSLINETFHLTERMSISTECRELGSVLKSKT